MAQSSIVVTDEARIGELFRAQLATEALWMPAGLHGFDDTANDDVSTLVAERRVQDPEVLFAVLASLKLVENSILERAEALSTAKI
jgi:hypothetical protein